MRMMDLENSFDELVSSGNGSATDLFFQRFARLELDNLLGGNGDGLACLGIAALALCPVAGGKSTKTHQGHIVTALQGRGHHIDECIDRSFRISLGQTGLLCNLFY